MAKGKMSVTFRVDKGVLEHNNRKFIAKNVNKEKVCDNITYKCEDLREKYHSLFDDALIEYNSKIRANRRIDDYYSHIEKSKQEKLYYEAVVQIGDKDNCGIGKENFDEAKKMLDEYMKAFEERNPNIKVFNEETVIEEKVPHNNAVCSCSDKRAEQAPTFRKSNSLINLNIIILSINLSLLRSKMLI